jgi:hypothetical protein
MENNPGADFNNIQTALKTLSTELPRIQPIQQYQQILHRFDRIEQSLQAQQQTLQAIQQTQGVYFTGLISIKNTTIQS